jgi:D-alanine-D-alanine ligase-like ATP-grasp enzyme
MNADDQSREQWVTQMFKKVAKKLDAYIFVEPVYQHAGYVVFKNKRKLFFRSERFNINEAGSIESVIDKNYCHFFLRHYGYNVPEGQTFFSANINSKVDVKRTIDDGLKYAEALGWPVILKPNNGSKGRFVSKVENKAEYYQAAKKILSSTQVLLVEKFYNGDDYRIVVFKNQVFAAYKRIPFSIIGNGKKNIATLLKEAKTKIEATGNSKLHLNDYRVKASLRKMSLTNNDIIEKGEKLRLLQNANVSDGGRMVDVTTELHPRFKRLLVKMTKDMNLILCGIDIISNDITKAAPKYVALEINSAPALKHYASIGYRQLRRTEALYTRIFKHLESN